jgi:hypothetical protein
MPLESTQVARDRAPARKFGVDGDPTGLVADLGEPTTIGMEVV